MGQSVYKLMQTLCVFFSGTQWLGDQVRQKPQRARPSCYIYFCFHHLLDEESMVTFKIVINLTMGQCQFKHSLHYCLGS